MSDDAGGATGRGTAATPSTAAMTSYSPTRNTSTATRAGAVPEARLGHGLDGHVRDSLGRGRLTCRRPAAPGAPTAA